MACLPGHFLNEEEPNFRKSYEQWMFGNILLTNNSHKMTIQNNRLRHLQPRGHLPNKQPFKKWEAWDSSTYI